MHHRGKSWTRLAWCTLVLLLVTGVFARFHQHGKIQEDSTHQCAVCHFAAHFSGDPGLLQTRTFPPLFRAETRLLTVSSLISFESPSAASIRGPPAA